MPRLTLSKLVSVLANQPLGQAMITQSALCDHYPALRLGPASMHNLVKGLQIAAKGESYSMVDDEVRLTREAHPTLLLRHLKTLDLDFNRISRLNQHIHSGHCSNDAYLLLSHVYDVHILLRNTQTGVSKLFYMARYLDPKTPFVIVQESGTFELSMAYNNNSFLFPHTHPVLQELLRGDVIPVGKAKNKMLAYRTTDVAFVEVPYCALRIPKLMSQRDEQLLAAAYKLFSQ